MTPTIAILSVLGAAGTAAVLALVVDMLGAPRAARFLAAAVLFAGGAASLYAGWTLPAGAVFGVFATGQAFSTISGLVLVVAALALAASEDSKRSGILAALMAFSAGGAATAATSIDLVTTLIGLEVAAMSGYALVSFSRSKRSDEAAIKYFVQGAVGTGLFLLGTAVLLGVFSADSSFSSLVRELGDVPFGPQTALFGVLSIAAAIAFKAGAAPFHSWAPDAYETAEPTSAALLAGGVKLAMIATLTSFVAALAPTGITDARPFGILIPVVFPILGGLAVLSVIVGSTVALTTRSYTRMLGYAGVAQVGYALIALAALNPTATLVFTATYSLAATAAFVSAQAFRRIDPEWDGSIDGLAGMGKRAPLLSAATTLALVSLAGIPPLLGFWGKFQAFGAAITTATAFIMRGGTTAGVALAVLAAAGVIGSIVSLGYYGGVVRSLYFGVAARDEQDAEKPSGGGAQAVVLALAAALLVVGAMPLILDLQTLVSGFLFE